MSSTVKKSLDQLIHNVRKDANKAEANFEATARLKDNLNVKCSSRQFDFEFDEPELLGGQDSAPNPVEYALAALGACQAITYKALATLKDVEVDQISVETTGDLDLKGFLGIDQKVRPGCEQVGFKTTVHSKEDPKKLERIAQQVENLCPALDVISNPVKVNGTLTITNKKTTN